MSFLTKNLISFSFVFFINTAVFGQEIGINEISIKSFTSIDYAQNSLTEEEYNSFVREHIFSQPEFTYAIASEREKDYLLTSAVRSRFPSISGRVINDEVLDRNIEDFSSIRKRRDDSFDAVAEINQPIYSGGKISSQVKLARIERNNSVVRKRATLSELIVESNSIFISANIYSYLQDYADNLLEIILPFKEKMENRVMSGAIDPAEYAVFLARLNGFQSSIYRIEAMKKTYVANYEYFFKKEFIFNGFPHIEIDYNNNNKINDSFLLDIKENDYLASLENVKIVRSDYLPQFGVRARYTEYDINKESNENDIRGGLYLTMPIFNFGKGLAAINAEKAKANATKFQIEIERKSSERRKNEFSTNLESSYKAVSKIKDAFNDTQKQRKIIQERILLSGFSPISFLEVCENEVQQLRILLETEFDLISSYYSYLHENQLLINKMKIYL